MPLRFNNFSFPDAAIAAGDFNDDGFTDIAIANAGSNSISLLLNSGTGSFTKDAYISTGDRTHTRANSNTLPKNSTNRNL